VFCLETRLPIRQNLENAVRSFSSPVRHQHEWTAWRRAGPADDTVLVPGVIDSSTNHVEHPEFVARRIETYAALAGLRRCARLLLWRSRTPGRDKVLVALIVGPERVIAGTDCGFGTFAGFSKVHPEIVFKKLAALAEGARLASARLYGRGPVRRRRNRPSPRRR